MRKTIVSYILKSLLIIILTLLFVTLLSFFLMRMSPVDPATAYVMRNSAIVTDEQIEKARIMLGMDKPLSIQYVLWIRNTLSGDLGISLSTGHLVAEELAKAIPVTLSVVGLSALLMLLGTLFLRLIKLVNTRADIELQKAYAMCAVTSGARRMQLLFRHILPNLLDDVVRFVCLSASDMVLAIAGFSFIGLGLGDDVIDWGSMVSESHHLMLSHPGLTLFPVLFIFLAALSLHILGRSVGKGNIYV